MKRGRSKSSKTARATVSAGLSLYRRILPPDFRVLIPETLRRVAKRSLGIKDPIVRIYELRLRLNELGFVDRALDDLTRLSESSDPIERQLAIWELAVWYANQRSVEASAMALSLLDLGIDDIIEGDQRRWEAVLRAECHATLGDLTAAQAILTSALLIERHADLHLAEANLQSDPLDRLDKVNNALGVYDLPQLLLRPNDGSDLYDRLGVARTLQAAGGPKITVIVPAFNAADHIATAIEALIAQTWENLEILVVDDVSTDETADVVCAFSKRDPRVRLIRAEENRGSYVARNIALFEASGEFVTTHDADDWSHPNKLETQARHLMCNPGIAANMSQQARSTSELVFHRRGNPGFYIFDNMSSLMFRRDPVMAKLGFWDSVRFGADSEFIERIRLTFGRASVASLSEAGPLSFQRQSETSLTGSSAFGFHGFFMGARLAYHQASRRYHRDGGKLRYDFPQTTRLFAVPEPMWPVREVAKGEQRVFDVVFASDFRIPGRVTARNIEQVREERRQGRRVGLIQMASYDFDPAGQILPVFRQLEDCGEVQFIVTGERISCGRLVILHAPVLEVFQRFVPDVEADQVEVLAYEVPAAKSDEALKAWWDACQENATLHFNRLAVWTTAHPRLNPLVADKALENDLG